MFVAVGWDAELFGAITTPNVAVSVKQYGRYFGCKTSRRTGKAAALRDSRPTVETFSTVSEAPCRSGHSLTLIPRGIAPLASVSSALLHRCDTIV